MYEKVRAALYALAAAVLGVAGVYGIASKEQIAAWLGVVGAFLGVLAFVNVPAVAKLFRKDPVDDLPDHGPGE